MAKRDKEKKPKKDKAGDKPRSKAKPLPAAKTLTAVERSRNLRIAKEKAATGNKVTGPRFPLKAPDLMPGVVPAGVTPAVAMDYCPSVYEFAGLAYAHDPNFQGFPGYPYLANLATRAEYRAFASTMASELFREWIKIKSTSAEESEKVIDNGRIAELEKAIEEYDLRGVFQRAAAQDCFFGRGQISVNIKGANDELPLILSPKTVKQGSLTSFTTVEAIWTSPSAYNALDPTAPDFYKPREWFMLGRRIHASRMLTITTRPLPDILKPAFNFSGISLSQLAEPYVNNWLRTRQSVSDLINNFSITALKTDMAQMLQGNCDGSDVLNRADFFTLTRSNRGLMMLDMNGEELVQLNTPLSGLHELQAQSQEHMCSVSRIPAMILTGISPSGLNASSEGEIRAFYDWISSQQQSFYKHPLDICIKLLMLNLWGEIDETITFEFNPLWQTSALEESQIRLNNANADTAYLDRSVVSQEEVRDKLSKDPESGYSGIDPGDTPELPEPEPIDTDFRVDEEPDAASDKSVSEAQHRAMEAAASGHSTLGIPESVGEEFVEKDKE